MIKRRFIPENQSRVEQSRERLEEAIMKTDKRRRGLSYGMRWQSFENLEQRKSFIVADFADWLNASSGELVPDIAWAFSLSSNKKIQQVGEDLERWRGQEQSSKDIESSINRLSGDELKEWLEEYDRIVLEMRGRFQIGLEIAVSRYKQGLEFFAEGYGVEPSLIRDRLERVHIETVDPLTWRSEGHRIATAHADNQLIRINLFWLHQLEQGYVPGPHINVQIEYLVAHEMAHSASRTMYQEVVVPSTSFVSRSGGLGFAKETLKGEDRSRFFWLNEATTDVVTNAVMKKPIWETEGVHYSQEVRLLELLVRKIPPPFEGDLFRAYFEGFTDVESQRASHFRKLLKAFRETFGDGFLVRLGKYLNDGGEEAMENALRLADSPDEKTLGRFLGINQ